MVYHLAAVLIHLHIHYVTHKAQFQLFFLPLALFLLANKDTQIQNE